MANLSPKVCWSLQSIVSCCALWVYLSQSQKTNLPRSIVTSNQLRPANSSNCRQMPRKPGMTRDDLFNINADIAKGVVEACAKFCPEAVRGPRETQRSKCFKTALESWIEMEVE